MQDTTSDSKTPITLTPGRYIQHGHRAFPAILATVPGIPEPLRDIIHHDGSLTPATIARAAGLPDIRPLLAPRCFRRCA